MKKIIIFFAVVLICVAGISYLYLVNTSNENAIKKHNVVFENCYQKEIYGSDVATIINKAIDSNEKNKVKKDSNGKYIENDTNSINIDIKMIDDDNIYAMETIYNNNISEFIKYYNQIKFKCTDISYHESSKMVKSLHFEQISV